ncbi:MAG TPA: DNA polymerase IV [Nitrososphaera sp.]|jgi:DNA polymerase IV (DinB-like DNA polymerase)|nr:DNA polymerase IV [Nitrososphaera sp.]
MIVEAPKSNISRIVMHVDFDYFFAQCEEIRLPALRLKPVVVCVFSGRTEDSGVVSTANYVARKYGVKSGIPIRVAKSKLANSEAVFLPLDSAYYSQVSESVISIIASYADRFEHVGIDECYLDVSERAGSLDSAKSLAQAIKNDVKSQAQLTCSIGVAPNKMLAKIASDLHKPDGLTVIEPGNAAEFIASMDVGRIPSIGPKTSERLGELGVKIIGDLAKFDLFRLIEEFGKKTGTYMHNASQGVDNEPVVESGEKQQIMRITTLKKDATSSAEMLSDLHEICKSVFQTANDRRMTFKTVGILLVLDNLDNITRSKSLKVHSSNFESVHYTTKLILDEAMREAGPIKVRRLGVRLSDLQRSIGQNKILDFMGSGG